MDPRRQRVITGSMLRGSFWVLVLYDVAERIDLYRLQEILGLGPAHAGASLRASGARLCAV